MAESNRKQAEIPASAGDDQQPGRYGLWLCHPAQPLPDVFHSRGPSEFKVMVEQEIFTPAPALTLPDPPVCLRMTTFGRSRASWRKVLIR